MAKEMHKSKSSGSNQVSFHKQMQRERGIFEQQGESQGCDTGKIFMRNISATKQWVQSLKFPWSRAQGVASVSAQQGFHPQEGKEQPTLADECKAMHRSHSSLKPYPGKAGVFSNHQLLAELSGWEHREHSASSY